MKKRPVYLIFLAIIIVIIIGTWQYYRKTSSTNNKTDYITANIELGSIIQAVTANGTLNPVTVANVGSQVSGIIQHIYVDFNQKVIAGQILARLNPEIFLTDVREAQAQIKQIEANLNLAKSTLKRQNALLKEGASSRLNVDIAYKDVDVQKAQLAIAQAKLQKSQTNLENSVIKAPISGVIMQKNVDVGQTVAASFQTPTLFQIAKNLDEMDVHASIVEADIGKITVGLPASFTVDAFENKTFQAQVKQIRINPSITQNVVTYNVVLSTKNDGKLLPGMTAQIKIIYAEKQNILKMPLAALKFKPKNNMDKDKIKMMPASESTFTQNPTQIYILEKNKSNVSSVIKSVKINTGIADQKFIEITPLSSEWTNERMLNQKIILKEKNTSTSRDNSTSKQNEPKFGKSPFSGSRY